MRQLTVDQELIDLAHAQVEQLNSTLWTLRGKGHSSRVFIETVDNPGHHSGEPITSVVIEITQLLKPTK